MIRILEGHVLDKLKELPDASVQCVITSPPYFGLRNYGIEPVVWGDGWRGCLGLEPTPQLYVSHMVEVFDAVWRVLKDTGTLWLNLGDSFCSTDKWGGGKSGNTGKHMVADNGSVPSWNVRQKREPIPGLKPKDLCGIPWRTAFALQDAGWYLRSDIIWHKVNPMPESVQDRPTRAHEYLFLLTKREQYYYDADAIAEPISEASKHRYAAGYNGSWKRAREASISDDRTIGHKAIPHDRHRNKRSVWTIPSSPFPGSHFATFPPALVEPCILAGTSEKGYCPACGAPWWRVVEHRCEQCAAGVPRQAKRCRDCGHVRGWKANRSISSDLMAVDWSTPGKGTPRLPGGFTNTNHGVGWQPSCSCDAGAPVPCTVLDPFGGVGTVPLVADRLGRDAISIELNPDYCAMQRQRLTNDAPLFVEITEKGAP